MSDASQHAKRQLTLWQSLQTCDGWADFLLPRIAYKRDYHATQNLDNDALSPEQREAHRQQYIALRDLLNDMDTQAQQHALTLAKANGGQVPPEFSGLLQRATESKSHLIPVRDIRSEMAGFGLMGDAAAHLQTLAAKQPILQEVIDKLGIGGTPATT